jgi:hypothetical protein
MKVEVKATYFEGNNVQGKKGDIVDVPKDPKKQSPATRHALATGNLVVMDLKPVTSEPVPEGELGELKYKELQALAKERGINPVGMKKAELIERLQG